MIYFLLFIFKIKIMSYIKNIIIKKITKLKFKIYESKILKYKINLNFCKRFFIFIEVYGFKNKKWEMYLLLFSLKLKPKKLACGGM